MSFLQWHLCLSACSSSSSCSDSARTGSGRQRSSPVRLTSSYDANRDVLVQLIEAYQARIEELERLNAALLASWNERGQAIKDVTRAVEKEDRV